MKKLKKQIKRRQKRENSPADRITTADAVIANFKFHSSASYISSTAATVGLLSCMRGALISGISTCCSLGQEVVMLKFKMHVLFSSFVPYLLSGRAVTYIRVTGNSVFQPDRYDLQLLRKSSSESYTKWRRSLTDFTVITLCLGPGA